MMYFKCFVADKIASFVIFDPVVRNDVSILIKLHLTSFFLQMEHIPIIFHVNL